MGHVLDLTVKQRQSVCVVDQSRKQARLALQARRSELGFTSQEALAGAADVGLSTVARLERGQRLSAVKEAAVERALQWEYGSIDALFRGEEPTPLQEPAAPEGRKPEPQPADYPDEHEYMNAVYWYLRQWMSHDAVMRGFHMAAAIYERKNTERPAPKAPGNKVG